ncbi:putative Polysaccharide deacetylase family protein [Vibrio chagasii]|nr:putative Polysaccharide deacetylase family protein [Vibrio chagasii]CAH7415210.1 putative Polysaccharide deacetylase family protein [Vibrio chagasii]CAH7424677.1 putative Polysaccharide deacetylase family protein [Vibrio chagasii]
MNGKFVISLDYEKSWGFNDIINDKKEFDKFTEVDDVVSKTINLFSLYNVKTTWAVVTGMLIRNSSINLFSHRQPKSLVSSQLFVDSITDRSAPISAYCCDIEKIISNGHEIASHTHTHVYCDDGLYSYSEVIDDIKLSIDTLNSKFNIKCKTIIFPRNQVSNDLIKDISSLGISCYRGNNDRILDSVAKNINIFTKLLRYADSYLPLLPVSYSKLRKDENGIFNIPASRFLRVKNSSVMNRLHLIRVKNEMTNAAKNNENYHLWWHPHNFLLNKQQGFFMLEELLKHFQNLNHDYGFESSTMSDLLGDVNDG